MGRAEKWICSCCSSRNNDLLSFHARGETDFLGDRYARERQSRGCHTGLAVMQKSPFAACSLERAPQINELPREAMSDLARHAQLKADQNGIAPLAPLGSSAFVLPICWLLPP
jgi:hypothetical protein